MASHPTPQGIFRFLDLPPELRLQVYEAITFPLHNHSISRLQSGLNKASWQPPPPDQGYESSITLITPRFPVELILTCRLVNKEASPILARKAIDHAHQPLRYIVDYSAAYSMASPDDDTNCLRTLLGFENIPIDDDASESLRRLLSHCAPYLSRTHPNPLPLPLLLHPQNLPQPQAPTKHPLPIELTIPHNPGVIYGPEVLTLVATLGWLQGDDPQRRMVFVLKSPLPETRIHENIPVGESSEFARRLLRIVPKDLDAGGDDRRGTFVRFLEEGAFEEHVEGLGWSDGGAVGVGGTD